MNRSLVSLCLIALCAVACSKKETQPDPQPTETVSTQPESQTPVANDVPDEPADASQGLPAPEDVAGPPSDAQVTSSGLASKVLVPGDGTTNPGATSVVRVHYTGWTTDGKMFDSSVVRNESISFPLDKVIAGWQEGVQLMVEGETRRFWIPADLAYGENPEREGAPAGMLVFDVELIAIEQP